MSDKPQPTIIDKMKSCVDLSLAAVAAMLVGIVLLSLAGITWLVYSVDPTRVAWGDYMTIERLLGLLALWCLTCLATYGSVRVWMNDTPVGHRRVREGWKAGMTLLSKHGTGIADLPCFIVFGCSTRHEQDQLVGKEGFGVAHQDASQCGAIDWHLSDDRILIFCRDVGVYARMLQNADRGKDSEPSVPPKTRSDRLVESGEQAESEDSAASDTTATVAPPEDTVQDNVRDTDGALASTDSHPSPTAVATVATDVQATKQSNAEKASIDRVLTQLDRANTLVHDAQAVGTMPLTAESIVESIPSTVSSVEKTMSQKLLSQLCGRLRAARFPHSPINGTMVMVNSGVIGDPESARGLGRAIRNDLDQLRAELGVTSPVTVLVSDTDHHEDFAELARRLRISGQGQGQDVMLGKDFESGEIPTVDAMNRLAVDAVRQTQNRIHQIFQVRGSLAQPQNHRLVRVLLRCRRWRQALQGLMVESCSDVSASTAIEDPLTDAPIVSGLYFASPGSSSLAGGFVRSVMDRMVGQQNHLVWTAREKRRTARYQRTIRALAFVTTALSIALAAQLWFFSR